MVLLSRIYTKTGDKGTTSLGNATRVSKSSVRIEAIGTVDEVNASLGLCRLYTKDHEDIDRVLSHIQNDLFDMGADLCMPETKNTADELRILPSQVLFLEAQIDHFNEKLQPLRSFVLPGGSHLAATLHQSRTITRRSERVACHLLEEDSALNLHIIKYLNRLSDLLFVLARIANDNGKTDVLWVPGAHR